VIHTTQPGAFQTDVATLYRDGSDILHATYHVPKLDVDEHHVWKILDLIEREFAAGGKQLILADIRNQRSSSRGAYRASVSEKAISLVQAEAVLVGWPISEVIGNLWLRAYKPPFPSRLFTYEAKALEWLMRFR